MVHPRHLLIRGIGALLLLWCCASVHAQTAQELLNSGQYREAREAFEDALSPEDGAAIEGFFQTYLDLGEFEEGLEEVERYESRWSGNPYIAYAKGQLLWHTGRLTEAQEAFIVAVRAKPDYWRAGLAIADLFSRTGEDRQARRLYETLYNNLRQGLFSNAADLATGAMAAASIEEYHDANDAFSTSLKLEPGNVQHLLWYGDLYRVTYDVAQAQTLFAEALAINPHSADLYVALAQTTGSYQRKESMVREALERVPDHVPALGMRAFLNILDGQLEASFSDASRALEVNPADMASLAHLATVHHLRGENELFNAVVTRARNINSRPTDFFLTISEGLALRFRYPDAAMMAQRAVDADPNSAAANAALGKALLRLGRDNLARRYLERAYDRDAFNLFVANTLSLLDEATDFRELTGDHIRLRIHQKEADILGPLMLREAEAAYLAMASRYPYRPRQKILIDAYNNSDDFAVRISGVPHVGLLGVSFGDILAVNTPEALGDRPYNWARTVWHEVGHTMAIGTSDFRVPRWLTEGLSVYEEQLAHPQWARAYELRFLSAYDQKRLHPLVEIDRGFTRPEFPGQVMMSYYHAYKVVSFIVERYGFASVIQILESLRSGMTEEEAVQEALGITRASLDEGFQESLKEERSALSDVLDGWPDMLTEEVAGGSLEEWRRQQGKNSLLGSLQDGADALARGNDVEAETHFREALAVYPRFTGEGNAYQSLMTIFRERGDNAALQSILEEFLAVTPYGAEEARELAQIYEQEGNLSAARNTLVRSRRTQPYHEETLKKLGTIAAEQGDYAGEVEMRKAVLALNPVDQADAYFLLARSLYNNAQVPEAKRAVLQSLEIAPGFQDAQRLLLEVVGETQ